MSAIERIVGKMMSQSSVDLVRMLIRLESTVHTPTQPQVQLAPCVDSQRYEDSCQRRCTVYHPQTSELEWIGRHLVDVEVDCSKIAIPTAWPRG